MRWAGAFALALIAGGAAAETIVGAQYSEPTTIYQHGVLGDAVEWRALEIMTDGSRQQRHSLLYETTTYTFMLPLGYVFEDIAPRLADVTGDGKPEVLVVETDVTRGAALAVYTAEGRLTKTPHIGQTHRWLSPIGAGDLDGDGHVEIAYIDRPHLAKTLRVWRYKAGKLTEVASQPGLTNHKIGWEFIAGGLRTCNPRPQIITASGDWSRIIATTFDGTALTTTDIGTYEGPKSLTAALSCP